MEKELTKKQEKIVNTEVKKRLREGFYEKSKNAGIKFRKEFKKQAIAAITAALAFLIALSWREPIAASVNALVSYLSLTEKVVYIEYLSAILVTFIAVFFLILISKWGSEKEK